MDLADLELKAEPGRILASNVDVFCAEVDAGLEGIHMVSNNGGATDEEWAQAAQDIKTLKAVEDVIKSALDGIRDGEVDAVFSMLESRADACRSVRLELNKRINCEKEHRRKKVVEESLDALKKWPGAREKFQADAYRATKGKRTLETIKKAVDAFIMEVAGRLTQMAQIVLDAPDDVTPDSSKLVLAFESVEALQLEIQRRMEQRDLKRQKAEQEERAEAAETRERQAVDSGPMSRDEEAEEWAQFEKLAVLSFKKLKEGRARLRGPNNRVRAESLAKAMNHVWTRR